MRKSERNQYRVMAGFQIATAISAVAFFATRSYELGMTNLALSIAVFSTTTLPLLAAFAPFTTQRTR